MPFGYVSLRRALGFGGIAAVIMALFSLSLPNQYRSEGRILPVERAGGSGGLSGFSSAASALGLNFPGGDAADGNFVDILQSRWLRERLLLAEYDFSSKEHLVGSLKARRMRLLDYLGAKNTDQGLGKLSKIVQISKDAKSKIIMISAETSSPELSRSIVRAHLGLLEEFIQKKNRTRGSSKVAFTEARLEEARANLRKAEERMVAFASSNRNFSGSADPSVRISAARLEVDLKLQQQVVTTLSTGLEQALMDEKNDIPILNVLDDGNLPIEKSGPVRSRMVMGAFFLVGLLVWLHANRRGLLDKIRSFGEPETPSEG